MVITMRQMVALGQLVEGFVLDAPPAMAAVINHAGSIAVQLPTGGPDPEALAGLAFLASAPLVGLSPLFLRTDDPDGWGNCTPTNRRGHAR
jgi:hypothetical protein